MKLIIEINIEKKFAAKPDAGKRLFNYLQSNSVICKAAHQPNNLKLFCALWDGIELMPDQRSLYELYNNLVAVICLNRLKKNPEEKGLTQSHAHHMTIHDLLNIIYQPAMFCLEDFAFNRMQSKGNLHQSLETTQKYFAETNKSDQEYGLKVKKETSLEEISALDLVRPNRNDGNQFRFSLSSATRIFSRTLFVKTDHAKSNRSVPIYQKTSA